MKIASYIISNYSFIFNNSLEKLLDFGFQSKNGNPIPSFDEKSLIELCSETQNVFENEDNLLEINGDLIIAGDIHGSLHDLIRILNFVQESKTKILFLGDYVDRGNFSLECVTILFALKVLHPDFIFLIRGNHEFDQVCSQYGFKDEILNHHNPKKMKNKHNKDNHLHTSSNTNHTTEKEEQNEQCEQYMADHIDMNCYKYTEVLYDAFLKAFSYMPIGAIVNGTTFCIHGGLSPKMNKIESIIKSIERPITTFEENEIFTDIVWSDPSSNNNCVYAENPRGHGYLFNVSAVMLFIKTNLIKRIIRGHECVQKGYLKHYNDKLITVFSASSYDKSFGNYSAVLKLSQIDDNYKVFHFQPLERLQKCDATYYKVQPFENNDDKLPIIYSFHHPFLTCHSSIRMVTNKKMNFIPHQQSVNRFYFHDFRSKSPLPRVPIRTSSSFNLHHVLSDNESDHSHFPLLEQKGFSSSSSLNED